MPYIKPERRETLDPIIDDLYNEVKTKGEVNYCITRLVHLWVLELIKNRSGKCYHVLSEGHSVLEDAAKEYYSAVMVWYENKKRLANGPVSELDDDSYRRMR